MNLNRLIHRLGLALVTLGFALGLCLIFARHASAAGAGVTAESRLTLGGVQSSSASYVQPDCVIGQDVIIGVGASLNYSQEAAFIPPAPLIVTGRRTAAELWVLYE